MMKPNRRRRERPHASSMPGQERPQTGARGPRPGKPPQGRRRREETPSVKEHPQYGTQIPPEELEFMRQQAEERARERKNRPMGTRMGGYGGPGRYGTRPQTGPREHTGPRAPRHPGAPSYPGSRDRGPRPGGPPAGRGGHTGYSGHTGYKERAPHTVWPGAPHTGRPGAPPRERFQGPPTARPDRRPAKPYRTGVQSAGEGPPRGVPIPEEPPLARLRATLHGYQAAAALMAAHALGVFPEVYKRPQVAADVARHLDVDPRGIETLLEALVALGMMHRHGATYVLPRELAPYFVPGQGGDATGMIEAAAEQYAAWGDLARAVREGAPRHRLGSDALLDGDPARVSRYVRAVHTVTREAAGRIAELAPLLPGSTLVDVAGGSGIIAAEYARRAPGLKATLFDLPPTIDAAREILREEGCADLVALYPGDYRSDPFPGPSDAILLSNVLQTESEENALAILRRAREALRPGGTLLVHGMMPPASSAPSADVALFALRMYLVFDSGRPWSLEQVSEWLVQEGFAVRASRPLGSPFASTLLVAARSE